MATSSSPPTSGRAARSGRAAPLSPPERRAALVEATLPLLRAHGTAVTTRQIAEAAGVAEGTIFSVFSDKEALIATAIDAGLDPAPTIARLDAVDRDPPLSDRLIAAVEVLQAHLATTWQLLAAVGIEGRPRPTHGTPNEVATRLAAALEPLLDAESVGLRTSPDRATQALLALCVGCSHPAVVDQPMAAGQIVDLFLHGVTGDAYEEPT